MKITYDLSTLEPYINWLYFYHAWQLTDADKQRQLHGEAEKALDKIGNHYHAHAIFLIANACSDGDDITLSDCPCCDSSRPTATICAWPTSYSRQGSPYPLHCLRRLR